MKKSILLIAAVLTSLTGCVKEVTIIGKNSEHQENSIDPVAAAKVRVELGMGYLNKGDMPAAKYNFEKAEKLDPHSVDAPLALAYYYQKVGNKTAAEDEYEKLVSSHSNNPDVLNNYGTFLCRNRDYDKADTMFMRAVQQPEYLKMDSTYENAGVCALAAGKNENALKYYKLALGYNPNNTGLMLEIAEVALKVHNPDEADKWLKQYQKKATVTPQSLWLNLLTAREKGRLAEVHVYGQALMQQFPSSIQAKRYQNNEY